MHCCKFLAIPFLAATFAASASAALIWDNGGPLPGGSAGNISGLVAADDFQLTDPTTITELTFWARTLDSGEPFGPDFTGTVGWAIFTSIAGLPGTAVVSGDDTSPLAINSGLTGSLGAQIFEIDVSLNTGLLNAGMYWLALRNGPFGSPDPSGGSPSDALFWQFTGSQQGSGLVADANLLNPTSWNITPSVPSDAAFRLHGSTIPEPSTMILLGATLLLLASTNRSKRPRL